MRAVRTFRIFARPVLAAFVASALAACGPGRSPAGHHAVPERQGEFARATEKFGPLFVEVGEFEAESSTRPWSSWWFPLKDPYLFQGTSERSSPLEKYDRYVERVSGKSPGAAKYERDHIYDPDASAWEGLCNAWAAASLLEPEPRMPVTREGVTFEVGDQKALIVKSYEKIEGLSTFGQRFNGDSSGVYEDIYAEQFHRVLQHQLFERGRPFIMDKDPGVAVWNTPVWKAHSRIAADPSDPYVLHVTTWLVGASPFVESYDFVGTLSVAFEFTYDLYGDRDPEGRFAVAFGRWTGQSVDFHPDFLTILPEQVPAHSSRNTALEAAAVSAIVK